MSEKRTPAPVPRIPRFAMRREFDFHTTRSIEHCADHLKALNFTTNYPFTIHDHSVKLRVVDEHTLTFEKTHKISHIFGKPEIIAQARGRLEDTLDGTTLVSGRVNSPHWIPTIIILSIFGLAVINVGVMQFIGFNVISAPFLMFSALLVVQPIWQYARWPRVMVINIYDAVGVLESEGKRKKGKLT